MNSGKERKSALCCRIRVDRENGDYVARAAVMDILTFEEQVHGDIVTGMEADRTLHIQTVRPTGC